MERKIYCFWTGSNSMSDCRKNSLDSMEAITGCKVLCIYKDDVKKYILPEHPLHEAYEYLSQELNLSHSSDEEFVSKDTKLYIFILTTFITTIISGDHNDIFMNIIKEIVKIKS